MDGCLRLFDLPTPEQVVLIRKAIGLKRRKLHPGNVSHLKFTTATRGVSASPASEGRWCHVHSGALGQKNWPHRSLAKLRNNELQTKRIIQSLVPFTCHSLKVRGSYGAPRRKTGDNLPSKAFTQVTIRANFTARRPTGDGPVLDLEPHGRCRQQTQKDDHPREQSSYPNR